MSIPQPDPNLNPEPDLWDDPTHFPADKGLELALLGAILLEPPVMDLLDFLAPGDFYYAPHQAIFARMRVLWEAGSSIDVVLVADRDLDLLAICTDAYAACPSALLAPDYARKLKDLAQKRGMLPTLSRAAEMSLNGVTFESVRDYLLDELDKDERRSAYDGWTLRSAADLTQPPAARQWLLEGLIFRGQISMWYGPPGILKTLLLMDLCAAMALGQNWLVRRSGQEDHPSLVTFHAARPARVLWLDYDNGEFETEIRIRAALSARQGLGQAAFHYMSETTPWLALDNASHVRRLITLARSVEADVIVFDALGMVLGDVDENAPEVSKVIARLKEIRAATGAALIAVHHPSKAGAQTAQASTYNAAGSAKFSNFFEWTVELRAGEQVGTVVADVVKHRGWAKAPKFAAEFTYTHFGKERPDLSHELESFKFYPAPLESKANKRLAALHESVAAALADGIEMNQKDLITVVKAEVEAALGSPVGEAAIREFVKALIAGGTLIATQSAPRQPVLCRLATPADER